MSTPRLLTIGLDAATFTVIDPLIEAGELPTLERLCREGSRGVLRSVTHPLTPNAWSTIATGVNAGRHGIWDFTQRVGDGYRIRVVSGGDRRAPAIWDRLRGSGVRSGLVSVPFTWPAPAVDGCAIAGFDAADRDEGFTTPPELLRELRERFGQLVLDHRFPLDRDGELDLDLVRRAAAQKVEIAAWLVERYELDFLFTVFMAADHVHHLCWDDWDRRGNESLVADVYRILDRATGDLIDAVGGDDVLVLSDHGGGRLDGVVNLNAYLASRGYLTYGGGNTALGRRAASRIFSWRRVVPERVRKAVKRRFPGVRERAYDATSFSVVDWSRTRAFAYGTFGNVVVNLKGREGEGVVAPEDYEAFRDEVAAAILELRGPHGEQLVRAVHRREKLCHGQELDKIPDLVIEFDDYAWLGKGNLQSRTNSLWDRIEIDGSRHSYVGSHRTEGVLVLHGPSAVAGGTLTADLVDVAPTILYLLGRPIPADLDGRLLSEIIRPELLSERPPDYSEDDDVAMPAAQQYTPEDEAVVEERLRSLGYLE